MRIDGETAQHIKQFLGIIPSFPNWSHGMLPNPNTQALKFLAQLLSRMFELEAFSQENRREDNVNVMLNLFILDDRESRVIQEIVEVFEEEAVEWF